MYVVYQYIGDKWQPVEGAKHETYGGAIAHAWELKQYNQGAQFDVNYHASKKRKKVAK